MYNLVLLLGGRCVRYANQFRLSFGSMGLLVTPALSPLPLKEARKESKLPKIKFAAKGERVEVRRGTSARY